MRRSLFIARAIILLVGILFFLAELRKKSDERPDSPLVGRIPSPKIKLVPFPKVRFETPHGYIVFELRPGAAPKTVANFLKLVATGWYNGTSLYRYERAFCLQGGGWPTKASPHPPVSLEYNLPNKKWAVSMARSGTPNSATSEFSIMLGDNSKWLAPGGSDPYGYAVFAEVVQGFDVIEQLGRLQTTKRGQTLFDTPVPIVSALQIS